MKTKTFDALIMKRQGAARIHEETSALTDSERRAYWEAANRVLQERIDRLRRERAMPRSTS